MVGFAAELRDGRLDDLDGEEVSELVALIADQSAEVSNIVEDLLVAARLDSQTLTIMPRTINVDETIHAVAPLVPRKIYANGLTALADPHRVRQILRNLFANAARYGGTRVHVVAWKAHGRVVIEVRDDGSPIPEDMQESMFLPYRSTGARAGLTASVGLGLTVSRRLAVLMGGRLEYRHEAGESVFSLILDAGAHDVADGTEAA